MRLHKILFFLCLLVTMSCAQAGAIFHDAQGNAISNADLKGKWVIVNYWAGWCRGCIQETPELNHFYKNNQHKNIVLLSYNFDQLPPDDLKTAIRKADIAYPVLAEDPASVYKLDDINVLPMTFILNPKGKVVKEIVGPSTEQNLLDYLRELKALPAEPTHAA